MTIAEQVAKIDNSLENAHLVLLDLAGDHAGPIDTTAVLAALADLEEARELLFALAVGDGKN